MAAARSCGRCSSGGRLWPVLGRGLPTLAVRNDVVDGAVLERVNLVLAYPACGRFFEQVFPERKLEESRFNQSAIDDGINEGTEFAQRIRVWTVLPVRFEIASCSSGSESMVNRKSSLICSADCWTLLVARFMSADACMSRAITENFVSHPPLLLRGFIRRAWPTFLRTRHRCSASFASRQTRVNLQFP